MKRTEREWRPTASLEVLKGRSEIINRIRQFFADREVLEVETPLLSHASVSDPHVHSIPAFFQSYGAHEKQICFLQTSPEYAMKRLLAAGSGAIYQIGKAFRQSDLGQIHNPEFTILEWYRPGFDHHDLMNEMDELLQLILNCSAAERVTYRALFEKFMGINPHTISPENLFAYVKKIPALSYLKQETLLPDQMLNLLFTHSIEPQIGPNKPLFLYDFPSSQAALAKLRNEEDYQVASRFEVYFKGVELANGFHELQSESEQRSRFQNDLEFRSKYHLPIAPLDENFLAALAYGLPDCAGVALGVDRLVMLALGKKSVREVISFSFENA